MVEMTERDEAIRGIAVSVFKQHDLYTLHSQVIVHGKSIRLELFPHAVRHQLSALSLELAPELRMYLLGIYLPEEWWGMGFGQQLYDLACELASELVLEDVVQYPVGKTARGELRRDYLLRRGWMPCEDDQVRRFVI